MVKWRWLRRFGSSRKSAENAGGGAGAGAVCKQGRMVETPAEKHDHLALLVAADISGTRLTGRHDLFHTRLTRVDRSHHESSACESSKNHELVGGRNRRTVLVNEGGFAHGQ